jgi:pyruvate,water dikinase
MADRWVRWFADVGAEDVARVGGKNASLGEMIRRLGAAGIRVPDGFATTADAYWAFLDANDLRAPVAAHLGRLGKSGAGIARAGRAIRRLLEDAEMPPEVAESILAAYRELGRRTGEARTSVAVRSSATAEDLPEASFAGQQESFLNVTGERALLAACRRCMASLFTDRAIAYRERHGFAHMRVALSVGVQRMVRADRSGAGVMFSIDTETGFPRTVVVNAAWGLGESVVQGTVNPDEYLVFKPLLDDARLVPIVSKTLGTKRKKVVYAGRRAARPTRSVATSARERARFVLDDADVLTLARWAVAIERHYGTPMDMEWAKDGETGELFVVQARPETVQARRTAEPLKTYRLTRKGRRLVAGLAVGDAVAVGPVCRLRSAREIEKFRDGAVLVTEMTDPDWVPIMKRAAAIVTDHGGRTSHAAIVSREFGLPAVVGTGSATRLLASGRRVTVSCAEGDQGFVYEGAAEYEAHEVDLAAIPPTRTRIMLNVGNPAAALRWWRLPADGVGLARMEFIVGHHIKVHPMALARSAAVRDAGARRAIARLTRGFADPGQYFVERLAEGIARIAASRHPAPVIVRLSDFKTNEYAALVGGRAFEPAEPNPMLGWRGASRYDHEGYREGFALECAAIRKVREEIGLANVAVMVPFCRTLEEADRVLAAMAEHGLQRGAHGLEVWVMAEVPSNVILAEEFAERFDGFSIGTNDLTQLVLGVDRDSEMLAALFDERNPAVTRFVAQLVATAHRCGRPVGLCGQAPSDDPAFARFLVEAGIDSISVTADSFVAVKEHVAAAEARLGEGDAVPSPS